MKLSFAKPSQVEARSIFRQKCPIIGLAFADGSQGMPIVDIEGDYYALAGETLYLLDREEVGHAYRHYRRSAAKRRASAPRVFSPETLDKLRQNAARARSRIKPKA